MPQKSEGRELHHPDLPVARARDGRSSGARYSRELAAAARGRVARREPGERRAQPRSSSRNRRSRQSRRPGRLRRSPVALAQRDRPELLNVLGPGVLSPVPCTMHTLRKVIAPGRIALCWLAWLALGESEEETVWTRGRRTAGAVLVGFVVVLVPRLARALELNGGVGLGGFIAGTVPRLAVSPHAGLSWRMESGFLFAIHDLFSVLPLSTRGGIGIYNQASTAIGYASKDVNFSVGPSFGVYSMVACSVTLCGRVAGLSPGGQAQANAFFAGPLGVSVSGYVNWVGGSSLVLPGGVAAMVVAGPVLRWDSKEPQ